MWAGISDPVKENVAEFLANSQGETAHVDNKGNRVRQSDIAASFDSGDMVGNSYSQSVSDVDPEPQ